MLSFVVIFFKGYFCANFATLKTKYIDGIKAKIQIEGKRLNNGDFLLVHARSETGTQNSSECLKTTSFLDSQSLCH